MQKQILRLKNSAAYFHFEILDKYTAGIKLLGTEIKAIRKSKVSFTDSFCLIHKGQMFVKNLHISPYELGTASNHEPMRDKILLLKRKEIIQIEKKIKEKGFSIVPLQIFINEKGLAKIDIALARGKKNTINAKAQKNVRLKGRYDAT